MMLTLLRHQKVRNILLQALFVGVVMFIVVGGWQNAKTTMHTQHMVSGFGFLEKAAGWDVNFSLVSTSPHDPYWWFFIIGIMNTLFLGVIGLALATIIGGVVGIARTSKNELLQLLGQIYVDFFRNIPLILQVFLWYALLTHLPAPRNAIQFGSLMLSSRGIYTPALNISGWSLCLAALIVLTGIVLPLWLRSTRRIAIAPDQRRLMVFGVIGAAVAALAGVIWLGRTPDISLFDVPYLQGLNLRGGLRVSSEFSALLIAMGLYGGAYIAEIVRGGFKSVGSGQAEAAYSLGLSPWQNFSRIQLPLAFRAMLPILANQYIWLIKATTLGITIGFTDFFMIVAVTINQSGQTLEALAILMIGFLAINMTLAAIFNRINKAIALKGNQLRS